MNQLISALETNFHLHELFELQKAINAKVDSDDSVGLSLEERELERDIDRRLLDAKYDFDALIRNARLSNREFPKNVRANTRTLVKSLLHFEDYYFDTDKAFTISMILLGVIPDYNDIKLKHGFFNRKLLERPGTYELLLNFYFNDWDKVVENNYDGVLKLLLNNIQNNNPQIVKRMIDAELVLLDDYNKLLLLAVKYRKPDVMTMLIKDFYFDLKERVTFHGTEISPIDLAKSVKKQNLTQADVNVNLTIKHFLTNPV